MGVVKRYAIVDGAGLVQNVVLWDEETPWQPPAGCTAIAEDAPTTLVAERGGTWNGGTFSPRSWRCDG